MRFTVSSRFSIGGVLQNDTPNGGKVNRKSSNCDGNFEENFERRLGTPSEAARAGKRRRDFATASLAAIRRLLVSDSAGA
jgi:hypothetical protein